MILSLYTYNGTQINDITNYVGFISDDNTLQGDARIIQVSRSGRRPVYASKVLSGTELKIIIQMKGTVQSQLDTLKALFNVEDETPHKLICKDIANSDKQWYVYATTKSMPKMFSKDAVEIILSVDDPVWKSETENSKAWTITASGQTNVVTIGGNLPAQPRFVFTPTSAGTGRYGYRQLWTWRNPNNEAMLNEPLNIVGTVLDTAAMVALSDIHVSINDLDGITADDTTIIYDGEVGDFPAAGMAYLDSEQISYTGKTDTELTGVTRGINGTTAATHADNTVIYASKIQADGDDIRVFVDGYETNRWLQDINTANTKVWIAIDFQPGISLTLDTAIAGSGAISTITIKKTSANDAALKRLPPSGVVAIENELFTYTAVIVKNRRLTGCTRAVKGISMAAHATGTAIYWIEHEIWMYYGSQTAETPTTDDTHKPIIDLTSTNTIWSYTAFWDTTGQKAGSWKPTLVKSANKIDTEHKSDFYTGDKTADADPATEMGGVIRAWKSGAIWKAENATIEWNLYNPSTFTEITATGEKYRSGTTWPSGIKFMKSIKGGVAKNWAAVWTEATPSASATWEALSAHSAVSIGTGYKYVKFMVSGSIGSTANGYAAHEVDAVTLTRASGNVPQLVFTPSEESCYFVDAVITNSTSGEWLRVTTSMKLNTALTIDCENKKAYTADNAPVNKLEFSSVRKDWLNLAVGDNTLLFTDAGTSGASLTTYWRDRNS